MRTDVTDLLTLRTRRCRDPVQAQSYKSDAGYIGFAD